MRSCLILLCDLIYSFVDRYFILFINFRKVLVSVCLTVSIKEIFYKIHKGNAGGVCKNIQLDTLHTVKLCARKGLIFRGSMNLFVFNTDLHIFGIAVSKRMCIFNFRM